jgi:GT2 family glycosyltransferase
MNCLVAIPSKSRPENIKSIILPFVKRLNLDYKIFVEPQESHIYNFDNVVIHDKNNIGLGGALLSIKKYAENNNYDIILKLDDDVKAIGEIEKDLNKIEKAMSIPKVSAICFPYDFEFYSKSEKMFTRENKRLQTAYFIKTKKFRPSQDVSTFEDFYQFLQIINNNEKTLFCSKHLISCQTVGKGKGGLQLFDRSEMAKKEIEIFRKIDSSITVISKPNKSWKYEPKFNHKKYKSKPI